MPPHRRSHRVSQYTLGASHSSGPNLADSAWVAPDDGLLGRSRMYGQTGAEMLTTASQTAMRHIGRRAASPRRSSGVSHAPRVFVLPHKVDPRPAASRRQSSVYHKSFRPAQNPVRPGNWPAARSAIHERQCRSWLQFEVPRARRAVKKLLPAACIHKPDSFLPSREHQPDEPKEATNAQQSEGRRLWHGVECDEVVGRVLLSHVVPFASGAKQPPKDRTVLGLVIDAG